jgi:hypothetical protein
MKKIKHNVITHNIINKNYRDIMYSFEGLIWSGIVVASIHGRLTRESVVDCIKNKL